MRDYYIPTRRAHFNAIDVPRAWRLSAYDAPATKAVKTLAQVWPNPDLVLLCPKRHVLIEAWATPDDRVAVLTHSAPISDEWHKELLTDDMQTRESLSERLAVAAGLTVQGLAPIPDTIGLVIDPPGEVTGARWWFIIASCKCAQRWPYHFSPAGLFDLVRSVGKAQRITLPLPESCDCTEVCSNDPHATHSGMY